MNKQRAKKGAFLLKEASAVSISAPAAKLDNVFKKNSSSKIIQKLKSQLTKWQRGAAQ